MSEPYELSALERATSRLWRGWVQVERPRSALICLRVLFFGLLTYDLWWIGLSHAPRYGAGGFNVPHLPLLSFATPSPELVGALYLAGGLLSLLATLGVGGRLTVGAIALLYNGVYLWSQSDSYQHHYLIGLLLALLTWAPLTWAPATQSDSPRPSRSALSHPGYDALFVQMALIYFWTAVAKTEPVWLSGETINSIVRAPEVRERITSWGSTFGLGPIETFKYAAWGVMLGEYLAPILFLLRPLRPLGFLLIPWFHISVEWVGFEIELFSYYMLALNLCLLSPARLWAPLESLSERLSAWRCSRELPSWLAALTWCGALTTCALSISALPVAGASGAALLSVTLCALCLSPELLTRPAPPLRVALLGPLLVTLCVSYNAHKMEALGFGFDYFRMWGGDLSRRGAYAQAIDIYQLANQHRATGPARHAALGSALLKLKRFEEASTAYEEDVLRWAKLAQDQRERGALTPRTTRGLQRAYEGWARTYELMGQAQNAALIRQQLQLELQTLSAGSKRRER